MHVFWHTSPAQRLGLSEDQAATEGDGALSEKQRLESFNRRRLAWPRVLGFGAATFILMAVPLGGLLALPAATVAGTLLVLELESHMDRKSL
jgi:hypothetical protein